MDKRTEVMVALGAAIGANCIPCFDHLYAKAKEVGLEDAEIRWAVETGFKVKNGAQNFMKNAVGEMTGEFHKDPLPCCQQAGGCSS
jgi:hypothetical protein